jgi:hypothetical protein
MGRIKEQYFSKLHRWGTGVDLASKTVFDQFGYPAGMVNVGVSQKDSLDLGWIEAPAGAVQRLHLMAALKEAAVNKVFSTVIDEKVGAGHAAGGPKAGNLHQVSSFSRFCMKVLPGKDTAARHRTRHCLLFGHNRQYI